jgi:non-specific serine/threonine protein kinase
MEYIDGPDMRSMIQDYFCQDEDIVRRIARMLLNGIKYLHLNDVIHRDIKPENIIFTKDL